MKKLLKAIFVVVVLSVGVFLFRTEFQQIIINLRDEYLPCKKPITYSIGSFDDRFKISKEDFLGVVKTAEETWEKSIDRELFSYDSDGSGELKINLIYDIREEASQKLRDIGVTVNDTRASYNDLKSKYNTMQADYLKLKSEFQSRSALFVNRQNIYTKEVESFNNTGGAPEADYIRLNEEKIYLDKEFIEINKLQAKINEEVNNINAFVVVLNRLVSSLNIEVKKFNTIGDILGGEFEEGTYEEGEDGKKINIYQFDTEGKLARILAHEFGHALGLAHLENSKAVMYYLNNGINEELTTEDVEALKERCEIKE